MTPEVEFLKWGGDTGTVAANMDLGFGVTPLKQYGVGRAIWDAAYGYVSGFPPKHIAYFALTRSINRHIEKWAMRREGIDFENGIATTQAVMEAGR